MVAAEAAGRGYRRLGLTGTRWLVDSEVYPTLGKGRSGLRAARARRGDAIARIIMDELVPGRIEADSVRVFQRVIEGLRERGCDAVVLGCTEIPLIIGDATRRCPRWTPPACWRARRCGARWRRRPTGALPPVRPRACAAADACYTCTIS